MNLFSFFYYFCSAHVRNKSSRIYLEVQIFIQTESREFAPSVYWCIMLILDKQSLSGCFEANRAQLLEAKNDLCIKDTEPFRDSAGPLGRTRID